MRHLVNLQCIIESGSVIQHALRVLGLLLADGEDFLVRRPVFFTKTTATRRLKVEKSIPRSKMDRRSDKGYKRAIDKI